MAFAKQHGLLVIEDAAHAAGAVLEGRGLGGWGVVGCYSFFSNKNMTTGEGGMLVTDDDGIAENLRNLRSHGMTAMTWERHKGHAWSYDVTALGYNYRIDEIHSAIGRVQLAKLAHNNARRGQAVARYNELLLDLVPSITIPFKSHRGLSSYHIFPILLPKGKDRLEFMESMKAQRIQTSIHYPPIHKFSSYAQVDQSARSPLPLTEEIVEREVTLPLFPSLTNSDIAMIVRSVQKAME
jgi:dTDP-4-amino-4,6-dideoxygalactose transaminase